MAMFGKRARNRFRPRLYALPESVVPVLLLVVLCVRCVADVTAAPPSLEYNVKAAFLLNFTKFVEWPSSAFPSADSPLTICIIGNDPFGRTIDQIVEGESVNGHRIVVERPRNDQQKSCQVLYFATDANTSTLNVTSPAVLTVGEGDDFIHRGGVIGFVVDSRHVRFDINLKAATGAGLKLSSKLLSVARSVEK